MNIIIVGGGIGGLTCGLSLAQQGFAVTILEQAAAFGEVGAGLQLGPNAMRVMEKLGLTQAILAKGVRPKALEMRHGASGRRIFALPIDKEAAWRWNGAPYVHIHRADLIEVLAEAAKKEPNITTIFGQKISHIATHEDGTAKLTAEDGHTHEADLIIGADGINSKVQQAILPLDVRPFAKFTGLMAWRATVDCQNWPLVPDLSATVWQGKGCHAVTYWLRHEKMVNLVFVTPFMGNRLTLRSDEESWGSVGHREHLWTLAQDFDPIVANLVDKADNIFAKPLFTRPPLPHWANKNMVLLGDAAHPMVPFMAQGAAMAMEDGWALSSLLAKARLNMAPISSALNAYEALRKPRASRMAARSWTNVRLYHSAAGPIGAILRAGMGGLAAISPAIIAAGQNWIYDYDITHEVKNTPLAP